MRTVPSSDGSESADTNHVSAAVEAEPGRDALTQLRRLFGRTIERRYRDVDVKLVFTDDTGQRGLLGLVVDVDANNSRSHRTIYSYGHDDGFVSCTTVGPGHGMRHRESIPVDELSVQQLVLREAAWARAFQPKAKKQANAAAEHQHSEGIRAIVAFDELKRTLQHRGSIEFKVGSVPFLVLYKYGEIYMFVDEDEVTFVIGTELYSGETSVSMRVKSYSRRAMVSDAPLPWTTQKSLLAGAARLALEFLPKMTRADRGLAARSPERRA